MGIVCFQIGYPQKEKDHLHSILAKNTEGQFVHDKVLDKCKMKSILFKGRRRKYIL